MSVQTDLLIDRFVAKLNKDGFPSEPCGTLPEKVRRSLAVVDPVDPDFCSWQITPVEETPWISIAEAKLPSPLPPTFLSLLRRYIFLSFEAGPLLFFANTGEDIYDEFSVAIFRDKVLSEQLLAAGFIHFAKEDTGDYDPICFDTHGRQGKSDYRLVKIDHEDILIKNRITVVREISPSFERFVTDLLR